MKQITKKPTLAIYDLTDCEGCQVELIALKEKLLVLEKHVEIVAWRLGQEKKDDKRVDVAIVEGAPITAEEIEQLKEIRAKAKYLIGLGSCATLGGIPAILDKKERLKWYKKIYGKDYKPRGIDAVPLSAYVNVDFLIHGCPINKDELWRVLEELLAGKKPSYRNWPVCLDCKLAGNPCRLLEKKLCLGPITQAGCEAICVSAGSPCYGCFGIRDGVNQKALLKILNKFATSKEIERHYGMFLRRATRNP